MPCKLWLDFRHCEFYLLGCQVLLHSCKSSWALFWDIAKLLGDSLILLGPDFSGGARTALKSRDSYSPLWGKTILNTLPSALWCMRFPVGSWEQILFPALLPVALSLASASGNFLMCILWSVLSWILSGHPFQLFSFLSVQFLLQYSVLQILFTSFSGLSTQSPLGPLYSPSLRCLTPSS